VETPRELHVHELIEAQASRGPGRTALLTEDCVVSYGSLNRRANQLARYLRRSGIGAETRVGLAMERSVDHVISSLAVFKSGAAIVPMNVRDPAARLARAAEQVRPALILTEASCRDRIPRLPLPVLVAEDVAAEAELEDASDLAVPVHGEQLYAIYLTSGSSGRPKAVGLRHLSLSTRIEGMRDALALTPDDRGAWLSTPSFSASRLELWPFLATGGSVRIGGDELMRPAEELRDWLVASDVSVVLMTAVVAERLLCLRWPPGTKLRLLHATAEKVRTGPSGSLPFQFVIGFAATETTAVACTLDVERNLWQEIGDEVAERGAPVGWPVPHASVALLDAERSAVPRGTVGELYVAGPGLARGYVGDPGLTAERFLPCPIAGHIGDRWYRTGDLVRQSADGSLWYVGRIDDRLKIRGVTIEPGEIEALLEQQPGVARAFVRSVDGADGDRRLAAYLVPARHEPIELPLVREALRERLPVAMLPATYAILREPPLNARGKIDRSALPAPAEAPATAPSSAPGGPLEQLVHRAWCELFEREDLGVDDDFFDVGGHSMMAARLSARIRALTGARASIGDIFELRTVARLAAALAATATAGEQPAPIVRARRGGSRR